MGVTVLDVPASDSRASFAKVSQHRQRLLYRFHPWQANLRVLEVTEIKIAPYVLLSHPFVERLVGTLRRECPLNNILDNRRPGGEAARVSEVFQ